MTSCAKIALILLILSTSLLEINFFDSEATSDLLYSDILSDKFLSSTI